MDHNLVKMCQLTDKSLNKRDFEQSVNDVYLDQALLMWPNMPILEYNFVRQSEHFLGRNPRVSINEIFWYRAPLMCAQDAWGPI